MNASYPVTISIEDIYCSYKGDPLAWTDPVLASDRSAFARAFVAQENACKLTDEQCDRIALQTLDVVAARGDLLVQDVNTDILQHYTLRRELVRAGAGSAVMIVRLSDATEELSISSLPEAFDIDEQGLPPLPDEVLLCDPDVYGYTDVEMRQYAAQAVEKDRHEHWNLTAADRESWMQHWDSWREYYLSGGGGTWPRDSFEVLLDQFLRVSSGEDAGVWRVGEFWSSASPGTKVLMLARGVDEIASHGKHRDFLRWVGTSQTAFKELRQIQPWGSTKWFDEGGGRLQKALDNPDLYHVRTVYVPTIDI
jgi:hypothetical protein